MRSKVRVGIVGCGAIGSQLAKILDRRFSSSCRLVCLDDLRPEKAADLGRTLKSRPRVVSHAELIRRSDLVIEAASTRVVPQLVKDCFRQGKAILVMSVGGLLTDRDLPKLLKQGRGQLFLPSGALAGVDALLAAKMGRLKKVSLITKKPPRAFEGAPFVVKKGIDLGAIKSERLLFQGNALEAVRVFPQNINVAALLSLAGLGARRTQVKIYASPKLRRNVHQVEMEGDFGRIVTMTENVPSPVNPKTSYLATLAPAALLAKIFGTLKIGT